LATNQIAQTGLSSLPPVIYYSEQLFSWSYERERRLVFVSSKAVEFSPQAVNSIAFGLRTTERDKATLKNITSGCEWSHVKWFQAVKSKSKYALEFERI
ncbi:hypothetical protein ACK31Q_10560, partial [Aeromonas caviae]